MAPGRLLSARRNNPEWFRGGLGFPIERDHILKVAVGVATYNRRHLVQLNAESLRSSSLPPGTELLVVDDASTEYDVAFLRSVYPDSARVSRRERNSGGASFAIRDLMLQLLDTGADAVLLLDSDMVVSRNFLIGGLQILEQTAGFLSLFNTPNHPSVEQRGPITLKRSVGSAATLWRRDLAIRMLKEIPAGVEFDWRFSAFLNRENVEICVASNSLVQHAGFSEGQNHNFASGDIGVGFDDIDAKNAYRLIQLQMFDSQARYRELQRQLVEEVGSLKKRVSRLEKLTGVSLLRRIVGILRKPRS